MQDEAPDGLPRDPDDGDDSTAQAAWWPWPQSETSVPDVAEPESGVEDDATLSFSVDAPAAEHGVPTGGGAPERVPDPDPVSDPQQVPDLDPEPALEPEPVSGAEPAGSDIHAPEADQAGRDTSAAVVTPALVGAGVGSGSPAAESSPPGQVVVNPDVPAEGESPAASGGRVGSIPAVGAHRAWAKGQWSNWRLFLVRAVSAGLSVILAVILVPGLSFVGWRWGQGIEIAFIFALLNGLVKPVLQFLSLRFLFSSYGIVIVLINTLLLFLLGWIMDDQLRATTLASLLLGGVLIGLLGAAFDAILGADYPTLDRDYKERNGLA